MKHRIISLATALSILITLVGIVPASADYNVNDETGIITWDFAEYADSAAINGPTSGTQTEEYHGLKISIGNNDKITTAGVSWSNGAANNTETPRYIEFTPEKGGILSVTGAMTAYQRWGIATSLNTSTLEAAYSTQVHDGTSATVIRKCAAGTTYYIYARASALTVTNVTFTPDSYILSGTDTDGLYSLSFHDGNVSSSAGERYDSTNDIVDIYVSLGNNDQITASDGIKLSNPSVKETSGNTGYNNVGESKRFIVVQPKKNGQLHITAQLNATNNNRIYYSEISDTTDISELDLTQYKKGVGTQIDFTAKTAQRKDITLIAGHTYIFYTYNGAGTISGLSFDHEVILTPDYEKNKLTGFAADRTYKIDGKTVTPKDGALSLDEYKGKVITVVENGTSTISNSTLNYIQKVSVPAEEGGVAPEEISVIGGSDANGIYTWTFDAYTTTLTKGDTYTNTSDYADLTVSLGANDEIKPGSGIIFSATSVKETSGNAGYNNLDESQRYLLVQANQKGTLLMKMHITGGTQNNNRVYVSDAIDKNSEITLSEYNRNATEAKTGLSKSNADSTVKIELEKDKKYLIYTYQNSSVFSSISFTHASDIAIDTSAEQITGFLSGRNYTIKDGGTGLDLTPADGVISDLTSLYGKTLTIEEGLKVDGTDTTFTQEIIIPAKPDVAPVAGDEGDYKVNQPTVYGANGSVSINDNADLEYSTDKLTWTEIPSEIEQGTTFYLRKAATENTFASEPTEAITINTIAQTYTITYNTNGHGTAPTGEDLKYTAGTAKDLPILTDDNYDFGGWYTDDETFNSAAEITSETRGDKTFYAKWTAKTYSVTAATEIANGSVTVNKSTASSGDEITVIISPQSGYQLANLTVDGVAVTGEALTNAINSNSYTFNMPAKAVEVSATFEKKVVDKVEITLDNSSATHGTAATINATAKVYAADNTDITSLYASDIIWSLDDTTTTGGKTTISDNGATATVSVGAEQAVDTITVTATVGGKSDNKAITVSSEPTYTITIDSSITGGTVTTTPSGSTTKGQSVTITATPDNGYQLKTGSIKVNDGAIDITDDSFIMPEGNVTVTAEFEQINYTITDNTAANANGSLTISRKEGLHYGDSQTVTIVPAQGYEFDTLTVDGVDVTASVNNNSYTIENITGNVTIAATFKKIIYTVIITGGEGIEGVKLGEKTGTKDDNTYTFTEIEAGEYNFDVTYTEGYEKATASPASITVSESKESETISAQKKKYIVTFKIDGQADKEVQVEHGSTAQSQSPQNPTKSSYHFVGWVKGTDTTAVIITTWDAITSNGTVYTAKFEENAPDTVTVTFNAGDGTFDNAEKTKAVTINKGATLTSDNLPDVTPPAGYTFNGWGDITGKAVNESVSYTAEYTIKSFTITWMLDENTKLDETTVDYNVLPTHADASKVATDEYTYTFKGWTPDIVAATGNAIYTAQFDSIKRKYTITWSIDGAETNEELEYGVTPSHANPTKAEDASGKYSFKGWSPAIETVSKAQTYTAQFDLIAKYTITYETDDGTINDSNYATVYYTGEGATLPTDVTKDGYTFAGWYDNERFEGEAVTTIAITETDAKTYYAKWTLNTPTEYLITFVNWDNTELQKSNVAVGTTPEYTGATPTKADDSRYTYEFIGWMPEIAIVSGIATYKAEFKQYVKPVNNAATIEKKTDTNGTKLIVKPNDSAMTVLNLYAAIYNANGSLKRVEMTRCSKNDNNIIVPLTEPQLADGETYKLMLWDISYSPLISAITSSDHFFN